MTEIILLRHAQSVSNKAGTFTGQLDKTLSPFGEKQSEAVKEYIIKNYKIDAIFSSDLSRVAATVEPTAKYLDKKIIMDKDLREIDGGAWQGKTFEFIEEKYPKAYGVWRDDIGNAICPGGESMRQLASRVSSCIKRIAKSYDGKTVLIATHATPIRAFTAVCKYADLSRMKDIRWVPNASISIFDFDGENITPVILGYVEHLSGMITKLPDNC